MRTNCDFKLGFSQVPSVHESEVWGTYLGPTPQCPYQSPPATLSSDICYAFSWAWHFTLKPTGL